MDPCFNLIDEKWIRLMKMDGTPEELTLPEVLMRAHEYYSLAGETPTQDVAMLRLLLAVLYAALFGDETSQTPEGAVDMWFKLWRLGQFPAEVIETYLKRWRERFWLFHETRPFFQVPAGADGINMENAAERAGLDKPGKPAAKGVQKAAKLNGRISESGNKDNLFNMAMGESKTSLSFPEAARWLIHVMGYDDGGIKPYYPKNSPMNWTDDVAKCSKAWLGSICPVYAEGNTLFETLMLNLVLLRDGAVSDEALWPRQRPSWESDTLRNVEMQGVQPPDNPAELYSLPFRRLMLIRREDRVIGFIRYVGEAFSREAAQTEQLTLWTIPKAKKGEVSRPVPRSARLPAQIWREMGALLMVRDDGNTYLPGVVRWISRLSMPKRSPLHNVLCRFHCVKALYDVAQSSNMTEIQNDSLTFSVDLLTEAGKPWLDLLGAELDKCDRAAWQLGLLAEQLMSAEGGKVYEGGKKCTPAAVARRNEAQERFYFELDLPFRAWLRTLRAEDDSDLRHARVDRLRKVVRDTALRCGREMLDKVSPAAYARRMSGEGETHCTAPEAWMIFRRAIYRIIPAIYDNKKEAKGA